MDFAGQACDYEALNGLARRHGLPLVGDGCHALGTEFRGKKVGTLADITCFSFHPVKHITTAEGGMSVTANRELADRMKRFRNHGISTDARQRSERGTWKYDMVDLGFNYRLSDLHCALGISQMKKLPGWLARRREIAAMYDKAFGGTRTAPLKTKEPGHAYHLYIVQVPDRDRVFTELRGRGIGANVHYWPVHLHSFYRSRFKTGPGSCPVAEAAAERILSLPMFPRLSEEDVQKVIDAVRAVVR